MNASDRAFVRTRAAGRCEYCRLHENDLPLFSFHVDRIIAGKHGGTYEINNTSWSCHHCNLAKSSNLSGRDRKSGKVVPLFNPRRQLWNRHFRWRGDILVGRTASARATVAVLNMNAPYRIRLRALLREVGAFPSNL
jgi:HNH endonuclease